MTNKMPLCPVCQNELSLKIANGRKSNKPFIMLMCLKDGRHFRGFIGHKPYIEKVLSSLEQQG